MPREPRHLNERLGRLPAARLALTVGLAVFLLLVAVFTATGESLGSSAAQAAFWAVFVTIAALGGRALGRRRDAGGPGQSR